MTVSDVSIALLAILMISGWGLISIAWIRGELSLLVRILLTSIFVAALLSVEAYEPILFFTIQLTTIAAVHLFCLRHEERRNFFSPRSLSLFAVIAVGIAVVFSRSRIDGEDWLELFSAGIASGFATLLAVWFAVSERPLWRRLGRTTIAILLISIAAGLCNSFLVDFVMWDFDWMDELFERLTSSRRRLIRSPALWFMVLAISTSLIALAVSCWRSRSEVGAKRWRARVGLSCVLSSILLPIALVYSALPPKLPLKVEQGENGFPLVVEAVKNYVDVPAIFDVESATDVELANAVKQNQKALALLRESLDSPIYFPETALEYKSSMDRTMEIRNLARLLDVEALVLASEDVDASVKPALELAELADAVWPATIFHQIVFDSFEEMSNHHLASIRREISDDSIDRAIRVLRKSDEKAPNSKQIVADDQLWYNHVMNWQGRSQEAVLRLTGKAEQERQKRIKLAEQRRLKSSAKRRLLIADLAIRKHYRNRGRYPQTLRDLEINPSWLVDPYCPSGNLLRYIVRLDDYQLYSLGLNHVDDMGQTDGRYGISERGDFALSALFPDEK